MDENVIRDYLNADYIGYIEGTRAKGCSLKLNEISNFVKNVGLYANLEIIRQDDGHVLFNTYGIYINRIFPEMKENREENIMIINRFASELQKIMDEEDICNPAEKIHKYLNEILDVEMPGIQDVSQQRIII